MRLNSTSNKFIFNFPVDFVEPWLYNRFQTIMDKNFIPYENVLEYINSTIKEIIFPSMTFDAVEQHIKRGKLVSFKSSKNIQDTFTNEIDITLRSVDSNMNYFIMVQLLTEFYLNNKKHSISDFNIEILDHHGDKLYTILFKEVLLKSIGENRMGYNNYDLSEKTFSVTFRYNWINVLYELDDIDEYSESNYSDRTKNIYDIPIVFTPGDLDLLENGGDY